MQEYKRDGGGGGGWLVAYVLMSRGGGVLPNSDPFGQTEKGGGCKNWAFFLDIINVWSVMSALFKILS